jgi:hypothetical protein
MTGLLVSAGDARPTDVLIFITLRVRLLFRGHLEIVRSVDCTAAKLECDQHRLAQPLVVFRRAALSLLPRNTAPEPTMQLSEE